MLALHADWSMAPAKRWLALARRGRDGWRAQAPRPVGEPDALLRGLLAEEVPVALGLDLPLGVPRDWAARRDERGFPEFLAGRAADPGFFEVSMTLATVSPERPFYPRLGVKGMTRAAHAAALGMASAQGLSRLCDRATALRPAGAPVFWTLGANQSGKAAIAAWRDWLAPALAAQGGTNAPVAIWPYAGGLHGLLAKGRVAIAEVYPAEALRQLGLRIAGSKRRAADRAALAPALLDAMDRLRVEPDAALARAAAEGFGADAAGEDRLDCVLGLLNLVAVLDGARPDFIPDDPWVRRWEGWVLGQTELPLA
jgi:hypothetical protein